MRTWPIMGLMALCGAFVLGWAQSPSPEAPSAMDVKALKRRIEELEAQNRAILRRLEELEAQLRREREAPRATTAATSPPSREPEPVRWRDLVSGESRLRFYGFLRLDLVADDSRPDNPQSIFFILSEDPRVGRPNARMFTLYPRLTRFGIAYTGPTVEALGEARLSGQLEVDFQNGGRESRPIIRIRHANLKVTRGSFWLLGGQTWDVISPLFPTVNGDTLMWNAGNIGDRRPQLIAAYEPSGEHERFSIAGGIGLTGAVDALDLDGNGFRDGEESARPNVQMRLGYARASWVRGQWASFGVWGHRGWLRTTRSVAGRTSWGSQSLGFDGVLPLHERVLLRGEAWVGRNLSDMRGGIGQGVNATTGAAVRSRGGWVEMSVRVHPHLTIHPGFSTDDPRDEDIPEGGRTRNRAWWIAHRFPVGGGFLIGAEYLRWITDYKGLRRGTDNRFNLFLQYSF